MLNNKSKFLSSILYSSIILLSANVSAQQQEFQATLEGHNIIPAQTFIDAPNNAPKNLQVSGKYTNGKRTDGLATIEGLSNGRPTGVYLPFKGQPIQGHSGIKTMSDGTHWVLVDNGAGTKANSPDFMLYLNHLKIDFPNSETTLLETIFLHDPDKKVPFNIVNEATDTRYLTGADFDPESFQFAGDSIWIGDEFGPYLIQTDLKGKVISIHETYADGKLIRSPDHYSVTTPGAPNQKVSFEAKRSRGYEGMAISADGTKLYALLEGALFDNDSQKFEQINNTEYLRILEFDIGAKDWTGRHWKYPLEKNGHAIGDFNMISENHGLIIERDNGEGVIEHACKSAANTKNCFAVDQLPKFKRVYKIKLDNSNANSAVDKLAYIDLLAINDPNNKSKVALSNGKFVFPFLTIENVDIIDENHIIIANDNNLPFSSSRMPNKADDNEFILLDVGDFLK